MYGWLVMASVDSVGSRGQRDIRGNCVSSPDMLDLFGCRSRGRNLFTSPFADVNAMAQPTRQARNQPTTHAFPPPIIGFCWVGWLLLRVLWHNVMCCCWGWFVIRSVGPHMFGGLA